MKIMQPNLSEFFQMPNPGLRAYLTHTRVGNSADYRTPFWNGKSRDSILSDWKRVFDSLSVLGNTPGLIEYELEMAQKVGPMSIQKPLDERWDSIESYFDPVRSEPVDDDAITATIIEYGKLRGLRLRSREKTVSKMKLNTNSGNWLFTKRNKVLAETLDFHIQDMCAVHGDDVYKLCAILGWRGQEGGPLPSDVKQRVVWMMAFLLNIEELQFYQPAIEVIQRFNLIPAYVSMDAVDDHVTKLFDTKSKSDVVICTDFSKFDQHFGPSMQQAAKRIISSQLCDEHWLKEIFDIKYTIPLLCDVDKLCVGLHGMGSGSGGTNYDECMAHRSLQHEVALRSGAKLNPYSMVLGDDGILSYPGISVQKVIDNYTRHGQEMNPQKQMVSLTDCVFLRRWHSTGYRLNGKMVGVYSTFRALGRLMSQERFYDPKTWGPEQVTLRAWSILENCKFSPIFEPFVDFVMKGDKFRLGLDIPGFMARISHMTTTDMTRFMNYNQQQQLATSGTSIRDWRIYQYLLSKVSH